MNLNKIIKSLCMYVIKFAAILEWSAVCKRLQKTQPCLSHDSVWTMADVFDVIVVGGGIVGCAVVWEMTSYGYKCLLLEKNENLVSEASSGNRFVPYTIGCFCPLLNENKKERKMIAKDTQQ